MSEGTDSQSDGNRGPGIAVKLLLPKFSKNYEHEDFPPAINPIIGRGNIVELSRQRYPNEWTVKVQNEDCLFKLLKKGCVTVKGKKCVIFPHGDDQVCGKIHWLPTEVVDSNIIDILKNFGRVQYFDKEKISLNMEVINTSVRFFVMKLKPGVTRDDIPHFLPVNRMEGLLTIKGREPMCFGCKGVGHRKVQCPQRKFVPKPKLKGKKKVKCAEPTRQAGTSTEVSQVVDAPNELLGSVHGKKHVPQQDATSVTAPPVSQATSSTASNFRSQAPEGLSCVVSEVNNLQEIVNSFSKRLNDALHIVTETNREPEATELSSAAAGASKKKKKKKKKKSKKSDDYDVAAAETNNLSQLTNTSENCANNPVSKTSVGEPSSIVNSAGNTIKTSANVGKSKKKKSGATHAKN